MMTAEQDKTDERERPRALRGHAARVARAQVLRTLLARGVLDSYQGIEEPGTFVFTINGEEIRLRNLEVETFVRGLLVGLRCEVDTSAGDKLIGALAKFAPHDTFSRGIHHGVVSMSDYTIGPRYEQEVLGFLDRLACV